jgi:hypothetical protein
MEMKKDCLFWTVFLKIELVLINQLFYLKAGIPVTSIPVINKCISCVPS